MKETTHALVGAVVGALVGAPLPAGVCGMISHGLLDLIPHDEPDGPVPLLLDGASALGVLTLGLLTGNAGLAAGGIGGVLPDLEFVPGIVVKRRWRRLFPSHWKEHQSLPVASRGLEPLVMSLAAAGFLLVVFWTWAHDARR